MALSVRIWGARGSIPAVGPRYLRYGGDTACVELRDGGETHLILDLGTGAIPLGQELAGRTPTELGIFLSHTHIDHVQGLPFFAPALTPGWRLTIHGPAHAARELADVLDGALNPNYSPLYGLTNLSAQPTVRTLADEQVSWGAAQITSRWLPHGSTRSLGYRIEVGNRVVAYLTDVGYSGAPTAAACELADRADLLIHDAMNLPSEAQARRAWGHSGFSDAVAVAKQARAKRLVLYHHDPWREDDAIDAVVSEAQALSEIPVSAARAGEEITP